MIYFDHNATTPLDERVLDAMLPFLKDFYGNPSALYRHGRLARSAIDTAREQLAALCGATAAQVIFTSGGTEANNMALTCLPDQAGLAISTVEHPSITESAQALSRLAHPLTLIGVDNQGLIQSEANEQLCLKPPHLVSIMLANNETGVIQDIARYAESLKASSIQVHTDAVQALGKIPLSFKQLHVDFMSLSSHKIYGPKGCGALVVADISATKPLFFGGGQERGLRAGTENVAAIVGFGKAAELALTECSARNAHLLYLRHLLEQALCTVPSVTILAQTAERLPNTLMFCVAGVDGEMLLMRLDQKGVAVSSGSACASAGGKPSPVLLAMGLSEQQAKSALRISLGKSNTEAEILKFIDLLKGLLSPV